MRKFTPEEIERLRKMWALAWTRMDVVEVHPFGIGIRPIPRRATRDDVLEFLRESQYALPDALAEIVNLRAQLGEDRVEAMDRVIGMLEASEAKVKELQEIVEKLSAELASASRKAADVVSSSDMSSAFGATIFGGRR